MKLDISLLPLALAIGGAIYGYGQLRAEVQRLDQDNARLYGIVESQGSVIADLRVAVRLQEVRH